MLNLRPNLRPNSLPTHALSLLASATLLASLPAQAMHHESGESMSPEEHAAMMKDGMKSGMDHDMHEMHKKMHGDKDHAAMEAHMKDMKGNMDHAKGMKGSMKTGMKADSAMIANLTDEQIKAMNVAQLSDKSKAAPHYMIGDWAVFSLTDGSNQFGLELFPEADKSELQKLPPEGQDTAPGSVNGFLLDTGLHQILFDTGYGSCGSDSTGNLPQALMDSGYAPEDIDMIMITHAHADHVCGLITDEGEPLYPKATVYLTEPEYDFWVKHPLKGLSANKKEGLSGFQKFAEKSLMPYALDNRLEGFKPGREFLPGITALKAAGHTPGHSAYEIQNGNDSAIVIGDVVHAEAIQLPLPKTTIAYDVTPEEAMATRLELFGKVAGDDTVLLTAHFPAPGVGLLKKSGEGFMFETVPAVSVPMK